MEVGVPNNLAAPISQGTHYDGFDVLRIFAALAVVLTHSFTVSGHTAARPAVTAGHYLLAFGNLGVSLFFVTSGFLVTISWERTGSALSFARNRFARIWPALTVLLLLTVFVLGPLATSAPLQNYFRSRVTFEHLVRNDILFLGVQFHLPGVFGGHPTTAINGSLWTLPYEIYAYVTLVVLGLLGLARRWWSLLVVFTTFLVLYRFGTYSHDIDISSSRFGLSLNQFSELAAFFYAGALCAVLRKRTELTRLVIPGAVFVALAFLVGEPILLILGLASLTIGIGTRSNTLFSAIRRYGDPSYGIYIFSFPIQQLLYASGVRTAWAMFACAAPLAIGMGYASWHFVESPALRRLKSRPKAEVHAVRS